MGSSNAWFIWLFLSCCIFFEFLLIMLFYPNTNIFKLVSISILILFNNSYFWLTYNSRLSRRFNVVFVPLTNKIFAQTTMKTTKNVNIFDCFVFLYFLLRIYKEIEIELQNIYTPLPRIVVFFVIFKMFCGCDHA